MSKQTIPIEWRVIEVSPNYEVSNDGRVRNRKSGKMIALCNYNKYGHKHVFLCDGGNERTLRVHRLVLTAFVGECPQGMECRHLDGDGSNNNLSNLKWGTRKENGEDSVRHGTRPRGEDNRHAKLTEREVLEIRKIGRSQLQCNIAAAFGVKPQEISRILNRTRWTHI